MIREERRNTENEGGALRRMEEKKGRRMEITGEQVIIILQISK